jgi:hypothetical protein
MNFRFASGNSRVDCMPRGGLITFSRTLWGQHQFKVGHDDLILLNSSFIIILSLDTKHNLFI